jgi:menaquinone-dependent protoporphyrinogen oxidase
MTERERRDKNMNTRSILLAYATRFGSTEEAAESVGAALRIAGFEVDIRPVNEVAGLDGYEAVVLGAAIYNARWHPEAHRFLPKNREALEQRPVAIFALGPLSASEAAMQRSMRQLDKELEKYPWLKPVSVEVFIGKIDPAKMGFFDRLTSPKASDHMDWEAIRLWAEALPIRLKVEGYKLKVGEV